MERARRAGPRGEGSGCAGRGGRGHGGGAAWGSRLAAGQGGAEGTGGHWRPRPAAPQTRGAEPAELTAGGGAGAPGPDHPGGGAGCGGDPARRVAEAAGVTQVRAQAWLGRRDGERVLGAGHRGN